MLLVHDSRNVDHWILFTAWTNHLSYLDGISATTCFCGNVLMKQRGAGSLVATTHIQNQQLLVTDVRKDLQSTVDQVDSCWHYVTTKRMLQKKTPRELWAITYHQLSSRMRCWQRSSKRRKSKEVSINGLQFEGNVKSNWGNLSWRQITELFKDCGDVWGVGGWLFLWMLSRDCRILWTRHDVFFS